jgi:hypothetical protein
MSSDTLIELSSRAKRGICSSPQYSEGSLLGQISVTALARLLLGPQGSISRRALSLRLFYERFEMMAAYAYKDWSIAACRLPSMKI